ncbi:hypothetical protein Y032_0070g463 [Ancylostoma ceylanicum]|uniref:Uncharacterized protein n=1 Tax=Ancylostoma ceylanicum TaxID=53326 RepID=A0A016TXH0_9BILA|nr:hypothetical protein Y032_0070g463 [Ancylostoma ceylanicum]
MTNVDGEGQQDNVVRRSDAALTGLHRKSSRNVCIVRSGLITKDEYRCSSVGFRRGSIPIICYADSETPTHYK